MRYDITYRDVLIFAIFKGLMGKKMLALRLRSSLVFFSPPNLFLQLAKKCPPDKNNTQPTDKQKQKKQDTSRGHPGPEFPLEKENNTSTSAQGGDSPLFSPGVELLVFFSSWLAVSSFATLLQESGFW